MQPVETPIQEGWDAYGSDEQKIGTIRHVAANYLLIEKGIIFVHDLYVPLAAVASADAASGRVMLKMTKDDVEQRGWSEPPAEGEGSNAEYAASAGTTSGSGDTQRIARHEEQLRTTTIPEERGEVRVRKTVSEQEKTVDVPVMQEDVQVRRVATDRAASGDEAAFQDGDTIRVPIRGERVEVHKEPRVVEELEITKVPRETVQHVSETVRRENIDVEQSGDVHVSEGDVGSAPDMSGSQRVSAGDTEMRDQHSREHGAEMAGGAAGAVGGALVGAAVGGPPGAVIGGVIGAAGGAATGEAVEGPDKAGSAVGGGGGALGGAAIGGAVAGPPGALVGGAIGAAAGSAVGDKAESETVNADDRESETRG